MIEDPRALSGTPRQKALAGYAALLTEAPWTVGPEDHAALCAAGLNDEGLVQATSIASFFNYVSRCADATGLELDYESPLPRPALDPSREPLPRPPPEEWPRLPGTARLSLALRPVSERLLGSFEEYVFTRDGALSRREREAIRRAVALELCDAATAGALSSAAPRTGRERDLTAFAGKLTATPWRMDEADLEALRRRGLDDAGLLDAISVISLQNLVTRLAFGLAASGPA